MIWVGNFEVMRQDTLFFLEEALSRNKADFKIPHFKLAKTKNTYHSRTIRLSKCSKKMMKCMKFVDRHN